MNFSVRGKSQNPPGDPNLNSRDISYTQCIQSFSYMKCAGMMNNRYNKLLASINYSRSNKIVPLPTSTMAPKIEEKTPPTESTKKDEEIDTIKQPKYKQREPEHTGNTMEIVFWIFMGFLLFLVAVYYCVIRVNKREAKMRDRGLNTNRLHDVNIQLDEIETEGVPFAEKTIPTIHTGRNNKRDGGKFI